MLRQFKLDWKLHRKSFFGMQAALPGAFLLGVLLVILIMLTDEDPGSWFCMGTLIAGIALCFITLIAYAFGYYQEFQLALSMGRTRMAFLGAYALRLILHFALGYVIVLALYRVEIALYTLMFPQYGNEVSFGFLYNWKVFLPLFLGLTVISLFIGSLYGRYGKKGMIVFYVIWLFCCFVLPRMADADPNSTNALDMAANWTLAMIVAVPVSVWITFGAAVAVVMLAVIIHFARTQMVK